MVSLFNQWRASKLREVVWPLRSYEFPKFLMMALLMFVILLNQNIVRAVKDSLVMTHIGAEVIHLIKLWGEMPLGFLFVLIYTKLCNSKTTEQVFRLVVTFFLSCFLLFAFVLFPNRATIHPDPVQIEWLIEAFPHLKWFFLVCGNWSLCLFYVLAELWAVVVFSLLYWQLANKITSSEEAQRFYPFLSLFGQANLLVSGWILLHLAQPTHLLTSLLPWVKDGEEQLVQSAMMTVFPLGLLALWLHRRIEGKIIDGTFTLRKSDTQTRLKLSIRESARMILHSPYLGLMALLLISYSMSMNLIEGLWMDKVRSCYPVQNDFSAYQGRLLIWTGLFTLLCSFLGSSILRYLGWFWGAISTPFMITLAGGGFFLFVAFQDLWTTLGREHALEIAVMLGTWQHVLSKGTKYSLFDATKEMAYIPLDEEMKTKGKAAVDIVATKVGKSAGAILQFSLFTFIPHLRYQQLSVFLMVSFFIVCGLWLWATWSLDRRYRELRLKENRSRGI